VPAFTRNWLRARGAASLPPPDSLIDWLALGVLLAALLLWIVHSDWPLTGALFVFAAALHLLRLARWRGIATHPEPLLLILHIGYAWLVAGLALLGGAMLTDAVPLAAAIHALTAGAMGTMILAVMTRVTLGHTGRELISNMVTNVAYAVLTASAVLRVAAAWPSELQPDLLDVSSLAWIGAFALFLTEYGPMLLAPRR
jgi:uncharacterized protein involved in response to NO